MVSISGNTYPVRDQLKKLGGQVKKVEGSWVWFIPEARADEARALLGGGAKKNGGSSLAFANFQPTPEQAALATFIREEEGNLFIKAGAGCGKTTVSLWLLSQMTGTKVMVAFNSDIKKDIEEKAPGDVDVLTMNALGYRALCRAFDFKIKVDKDHLMENVIRARVTEGQYRNRYGFYVQVKRLVDFAKGALANDQNALLDLVFEYDLQFEDMNGGDATDEAIEMALSILREQASVGVPAVVDFNDQMWLPTVMNLPLPKYDVVVIDESQDTNPLQLEMLSRCVAKGGRVIAVGDPKQAIYFFRGADSSAVDKIVERFDMTVLPLMTTFRCGKAIVREAQNLVPDFQAGPGNHEGSVSETTAARFFHAVQPGDMVLSRTNAPLAAACLKLLKLGKPASIAGKADMSASLIRLIKKLSASSVEDLEQKLAIWLGKETAKISKKLPVNENALALAEDKHDTILAFCDDAADVADVIDRIERLFSDDKGAGGLRIDLSSTHKAKGRERDRVWLFRDTYMLPKRGRDGEWLPPSEEEENLLYVGVTRAKHELVYVDGMKKLQKDRH